MKIEGFVYPENIVMVNASNDSDSVSFEEGQVLNARVLSCEKSVALLKTEAGHILRAKLDAGVIMEKGSVVTLVATGHRDGVTLLKLVPGLSDRPMTGEGTTVNTDMDILPQEISETLVRMLDKLEISITKDVIGHIYTLVKQNSDLSPEKIIFMVANNMEPHEADSLFRSDNTAAKLLGELIRLVNSEMPGREQAGKFVEYADAQSRALDTADTRSTQLPGEKINSGALDNFIVRQDQTEQGLEPALVAEREIPVYIRANVADYGGVRESPSGTYADMAENELKIIGYANQRENIEASPAGASTGKENVAGAPGTQASRSVEEGALSEAGSNQHESKVQENIATGQTQYAAQEDDEAQKVLIRLISRMPAYRENPGYAKISEKNIEETAKTIINVMEKVRELKSSKTDGPEKLIKYLKDIFVELTGEEEDGKKLKKARDELYARLTLLKEELPGMELRGKTELIEQTQKLLNHIKAFNAIDQYIYSQIPILLNGEYRTAELYFFRKRKGGRKIDPENVKILLALDLKNLGRFEGLVSIKGREVSLRIEVSKAAAKTAFLQDTIKLHKMLAEIGYKLTNIIVEPMEKETSAENAMLKLIEFEESIKPALDLSI